jgi:hypothetical protein
MLHESLIWHRESRLIVVVVAAVVDHNFALLGHVRAGGPDRTLRRRHVRGRLRNEAERAHGGPRTQQRRQRVGPMGEVALQGRMGVEWMVVTGQRRHFQLLQLGLLKPLRFGAPVLEPDLHLGLREPQAARELRPLRYAEVLLIPELLLECQELLRGEGRPGLPVGLVLPQIALQLGRFPVGIDCVQIGDSEGRRSLEHGPRSGEGVDEALVGPVGVCRLVDRRRERRERRRSDGALAQHGLFGEVPFALLVRQKVAVFGRTVVGLVVRIEVLDVDDRVLLVGVVLVVGGVLLGAGTGRRRRRVGPSVGEQRRNTETDMSILAGQLLRYIVRLVAAYVLHCFTVLSVQTV